MPALERALRDAQLIVIDEIAPMELHSPRLVDVVTRVFDSPKDLVVTFKERCEHPLIARIRAEFSVFTITLSSRDQLFHKMLSLLRPREPFGRPDS